MTFSVLIGIDSAPSTSHVFASMTSGGCRGPLPAETGVPIPAPLFRIDSPTPTSHVFTAMSKTLFEKIAAREIPATIVYEDDLVVAFRDIKPQAPTHVLIVPKKPIPRISEAKPEDHQVLGHLLLKAAEVAE